MSLYRITLWPQLKKADSPIAAEHDWPGLVAFLSQGTSASAKETVGMWGPYSLLPDASYRRDISVDKLCLAVFDVDVYAGNPEAELAECRRRLTQGGLAQHWYSTWSYGPAKQAWRLVLPLDKPINPDNWAQLRNGLISKYAIPANPSKCTAKSHPYYLPSYPVGGMPCRFLTVDGSPLVVELATAPQAVCPQATLDDWEPDEGEYVGTATLEELRGLLRQRLTRFGPTTNKAVWLGRLIAGLPLAEHGERNEAMYRTAGVVAWTVPTQYGIAAMYQLMEPSVQAMIAAGSKMTPYAVKRALRSARRSREYADRSIAVETARWT